MLMRLVASSPLTLLRTGAAVPASRATHLPAAAASLLRGARAGGARRTGGGGGGGLPAAAAQHVGAGVRTGHASGQGQARRMSIARAVTTKEEPDTVGDAFLADGDFESLGCSTELANALRGSGFRRPTTVQVRHRPCVARPPSLGFKPSLSCGCGSGGLKRAHHRSTGRCATHDQCNAATSPVHVAVEQR